MALALYARHFPPFQIGRDPPARRRLLRGGDLRGAVRGRSGSWRRGDGNDADQKAAAAASERRPAQGSGRWSLIWALGMFAIFLGERMIGSGRSRTVATVLGPGAGDRRDGRALRARRQRGPRPPQARAARCWRCTRVGLGAVLLYVIQSDLWASAFKQPLERNWPKLSTVLSALWPVVWVAAAWPILLIELALRRDGARAAPGAGADPQRDAVRLRPGRRADRGVLVRLRRLGARQEARPRLLPHLAARAR